MDLEQENVRLRSQNLLLHLRINALTAVQRKRYVAKMDAMSLEALVAIENARIEELSCCVAVLAQDASLENLNIAKRELRQRLLYSISNHVRITESNNCGDIRLDASIIVGKYS